MHGSVHIMKVEVKPETEKNDDINDAITNIEIFSLNYSTNYTINLALAARVHIELKPSKDIRKRLVDLVISIRALLDTSTKCGLTSTLKHGRRNVLTVNPSCARSGHNHTMNHGRKCDCMVVVDHHYRLP